MKLITWNICCLSNVINLYQNPKNSIRHVIKVLNAHKADVICLQEVFDKNIRTLLKQEFKQYNQAYEHTPHLFKINSGLMIFSRLPIISCDFITYNASCGEDSFANKGFMVATVGYNSSYFTIYNTHLNNQTPIFRLYKSGFDVIEQQFSQLLGHLYHSLNTNNRVYLCGDFNIDTFHIKQFINKSIFRNSLTITGFSTQTTLNEIYDTIDHILIVSKCDKVKCTEETQYIYNPLCSDHYAIIKKFILD